LQNIFAFKECASSFDLDDCQQVLRGFDFPGVAQGFKKKKT